MKASPSCDSGRGIRVVKRVRERLAALGEHANLSVRSAGAHVVIAPVEGAPLARITRLGDGDEAWGLSFRDGTGRWEPMLLVDELDAVVTSMSAALQV
jgi:hypothetical protein